MVTEETKSMKQINEECIINHLPGDLIERVFLRLPVSTLLTCVGVCKHWHNIIRDPQFVALHLQCAPSYALVFFPPGLVSGKHYPSDAVLIDEAWSPSTYTVPVIGPGDFLFGSCNGLLGLYTKTSMIKIANLATGECLHLGKPVKNLKGDHFCFYSFGFHPVTKEYKITHFLGDCINGRPHNKDKFNIIQVYTLGDEKWKDIQTPEALSLISVRNSGVVNVDGKMYWLTEDMSASWQHSVLSFDLLEESFAMIQLPAAREDHDYYGSRKFLIRDIDGKICIVTAQTSRYDARTLVGELQIWALDNMVEQRWSQKYNIKYPPDYILGPRFVHRDRILTQRGHNNVCSYELLGENFEIDSSKMVKLLDFSPCRHNLQSHNCVKSLVRLDVYKNAKIVCRPKQREGWELNKWEAWERGLSENEKLRSVIHQVELNGIACAQQNGIWFNDILQHILDDAIRREIGMKIDQIFPNFPDQQTRPLRHLNCVAQKLDQDNLIARINNSETIIKAMIQTTNSIFDMIDSAVDDQIGASSTNAGISSQNHSEGDDAKT
ncbi:putative F-box protein At3g23960 isoform X1 [Triticum dicoccoides]|uniref:putative F-box protein At3g23960 isoform X1 n=1 Tax=Triticum dicoccoides TaxID=85692 RepID=UPI00188FE11D|nr:putative F-box protein At3g23960 isoform X1 [Triticum dicoccoides]